MDKKKKIDYGKTAILISRISTPEQCLSQNLMPQLNDLKEWAKELGFKNFYPIGTTESGFLKEDDKQGWNLVTDYLEKNPSCKVIICTEISRLSRLEPILLLIRDYLCEHQIQLLIKDIGFSLLDEYGNADQGKKLIFSLYASLASSEMATKKERFKRALKDYRKLGYSIGGKELFGYTRVYDNKLIANKKKARYIENPIEADEIRKIYNWYAYGIDNDERYPSVFRITRECIARGMSKYLHSKRNVNKCLKEEAYTGYKKTKNKKKNPEYWNYKQLDKPKYIECDEYECTYPTIIEKPLFDYVKELMKKRNSHNIIDSDKYVDKSSKHTTILAKLILCPECGKYLVGQYRISKGLIKHSYRCAYSRGTVHVCSNKTAPSMVLMDSAIWAYVKSSIKFIVSKKNIHSTLQRIEDLQLSIDRLKEKNRQYDNEIDTASTIFSNKMRYANNEEYKEKAKKEYKQKLRNIERERLTFIKDIRQKEKQLHELEKHNTSMSVYLDKDITNIENNKLEMYNYIHLIIKSITPLFNDRQYTCLLIETFKEEGNKDFFLDFNHSPKKKLSDTDYLLINKKDSNRIKLKTISGKIQWDSASKSFIQCNEDTSYKVNIGDLFSTEYKKSSFVSVEDLDYKRLRFYDEDIVSG